MNILTVEDDQSTREEVSELLDSLGHDCIDSGCAEEALQYIRSGGAADLILFDLNMPGTSGLDLIREVRHNPEMAIQSLPAICLTGSKDADVIVELLRTGVTDVLFKPLRIAPLKAALYKVESETSRRKSQESQVAVLDNRLAEKEKLIEGLSLELSEAQGESVFCLAHAAEYKDPGAVAHLERIGQYAVRMAELLGWSEERCSIFGLAAPLHDVGKICIPDTVLYQSGTLTSEEFNCLKSHTTQGAQILSVSKSPVMRLGAKIAHYHHENYDGTGYPCGLVGNQIPIEAMIVAIIDVYDALRTSRPYREALDHATAIDIMCNGDERTDISKFHPDLLKTFLHHHHDFGEIFGKNSRPSNGSLTNIASSQILPVSAACTH
ncbi:MAG: HD domain-containing phosphohydrolase [Halioglobus sp.]